MATHSPLKGCELAPERAMTSFQTLGRVRKRNSCHLIYRNVSTEIIDWGATDPPLLAAKWPYPSSVGNKKPRRFLRMEDLVRVPGQGFEGAIRPRGRNRHSMVSRHDQRRRLLAYQPPAGLNPRIEFRLSVPLGFVAPAGFTHGKCFTGGHRIGMSVY